MSEAQPGGKTASLFLVPTLLGAAPMGFSLPLDAQQLARCLEVFVAESAKSARQFLKAIGYPRPLVEVQITELNEHTPAHALPALLAPLQQGRDVGLLSEAGCPAIADPGSALVALAHASGLRVRPLVGPCALTLALMASGLNGQRFSFHGYLPIEREARKRAILALEADSRRDGAAQLFIEAPYRNNALLEALLEACRPDTRLCIATDLTLADETIRTRRIGDWRQAKPDLNRRPTVFIMQSA